VNQKDFPAIMKGCSADVNQVVRPGIIGLSGAARWGLTGRYDGGGR
jgi:hypothetical protein